MPCPGRPLRAQQCLLKITCLYAFKDQIRSGRRWSQQQGMVDISLLTGSQHVSGKESPVTREVIGIGDELPVAANNLDEDRNKNQRVKVRGF